MLSPKQKIERTALKEVLEYEGEQEYHAKLLDENFDISELTDKYRDGMQETLSGIRDGEFETGIDCESTRNYEVKGVASEMLDGSYVGWPYYFGGGKYANLDEIDWMSDAYDLEKKDEEKLVVVTTWSKVNERSEL